MLTLEIIFQFIAYKQIISKIKSRNVQTESVKIKKLINFKKFLFKVGHENFCEKHFKR